MGKLRGGELLTLVGAICVVLALIEPWYASPVGNLDIWDTFGGAAALLLAALAGGLAVVVAALTERESPGLPVSSAVWCVLVGTVGSIAALVRVLERPDGASGLCAGAWLGLAGALAIAIGAWLTLRDERPSRYPPARPEPRPHP
jgi:hypothetical protein